MRRPVSLVDFAPIVCNYDQMFPPPPKPRMGEKGRKKKKGSFSY